MRPDRTGGSSSDLPVSNSNHLESTYDVFQQAYSTTTPDLGATPESPRAVEITITAEIATLLEIYQTGIGVWMDVLDHSHTYQRDIVRRAVSSPLLLHSICALSAKQMSLIRQPFLWEPVSARHYGKSLSLLIEELEKQPPSREVLIVAAILLCSYELLTQPGTDYQKHLYGARSLFQPHGIAAGGTKLEKASFWIYARQDVSMALVHEQATLMPPQEWPVVPDSGAAEEDEMANHVLWILARVIQVKFTNSRGDLSDEQINTVNGLLSELDRWWERFPLSARGIVTTEISDSGLPKIWFCVPSTGDVVPVRTASAGNTNIDYNMTYSSGMLVSPPGTDLVA